MRTSFLLAALICAGTGVLHAVAPNLTSTVPAGVQRGTEAEITFRGDRLADTQEILLYSPGIEVVKIEETKDNAVKARLKIAPDCRLGEHAVRLRTATGISALRIFYVGTLPAVEEVEPNNSISAAQKINLNVTVAGRVNTEDIDYFVVEAKKNQRLSVEVEGARLGRTMFDPYVAIEDHDGKTLAFSDDTALLTHDAFTSMLAPADGKYFIQVRDSSFSVAGEYRLHVGTFPRPMAVFPLGGKVGETLEAKFTGDPAGDFVQKIKLPAEPDAKFGVVAEHDGVAVSPNWVRVSPFPNVLEVEPNDDLTKAPLVSQEPPFAFNGVLAHKDDVDYFRFKARKDQNLDIQVYARRLGSPLDSVLQVFNAKGGSLGQNDDSAGNPDSSLKVRIPADGEYIVKVVDQLGRGGPSFTYRVEVAEAQPSLVLSIPDTARYDNETRKSIAVPRGNRFAILMNAARDNFSGDLKIKLDGLPKGIKMFADLMPASLSAVPIVFEAAPDAPIDGNLLAPYALPTDPAKQVQSSFRHNVEWVRIQNDTVYVRSHVNQIAAAVTEEAPFKVQIIEPKVPLVQNGYLDLKIVAERKEGFDEPITVKMLWNPPGVGSLPDMVIPKGSNSVFYRLNANGGADTRQWKIAVVASAPVKGAPLWISSQLASLEVAPPYVAGKIELTSVERGKTIRMVCKLDQKTPFEGKAVAKLVNLPANTTARDLEITKDDKEVVFDVVTDEKSPAGLHKNVFCNVIIIKDAEPIAHNIATGSTLRIDVPRVKLADAKVAGKTEAATAPAKPAATPNKTKKK